ncbi:acyl-CoA dehydrogenase family protein [Paralcaligenes ureilyticus]|uniref:Alkylation response protein AidB-like acyl-CoA dehydrogenase n=1 Tax=Paralcaligenes ureilyticus TaxID=627131 RepID=A0A4R3M131_9BURK|nr:acyl-CoA dehydrogenase family protein [Paralcaligenes ureilyticus]TCT04827.1 alkylation response protein AidB-like acyl-CoA dehydrogenase [Paralcaligenes ureilyticus]
MEGDMLTFSDAGENKLLAETVRRFIKERLAPLEAEIDATGEVDHDVIQALKKEAISIGLFGYNMPRELGGPGISAVAQSVMDEEIGHTSMPLSEVFGHLPGSLRFADENQREWLIKPLMQAEKTIAYALTEPTAGSDLSAINTRAMRVSGGWELNGTKHFISGAEHADYIIVLAATNKDAPLKNRLSTFIVERENPGLKLLRRFKTMGWRGHPLSELALDSCFVPDKHMLGQPGQGFLTMMATINKDRLMVASKCAGIAQALMDIALPYTRERKTFGKRLADHQAIQFMVADCDVELDAARLLNRKAAHLADSDSTEFRIAASRAKLYASEMGGRVADRVMQIMGGAGYTTDLPVERFYRDVRAFRIGEGTSEMQRLQIARHVLDN